MTVEISCIRLAHGADLPLPDYATAGAAGLDLRAAIAANAPLQLDPGQRTVVPTGLCVALPEGFEAQIRPRSGLALRNGVTVLNTPGTVDSDFRGEICVILINLGQQPFEVHRGDRIAQLVVTPVVKARLTIAKTLPQSERGNRGFGSTGR